MMPAAMSDSHDSRFQWSDAWLMLAVGVVGESPAPLTRVLGAADGLQHAILTREELNGAIARLCRAGYLRHGADGLELTSDGWDLFTRAGRNHRSWLKQQETLQRLLGAAPWSAGHDPLHAAAGEPEAVSEEAYKDALRDYYGRVGYEPPGGV
jgi:hypothetical protein